MFNDYIYLLNKIKTTKMKTSKTIIKITLGVFLMTTVAIANNNDSENIKNNPECPFVNLLISNEIPEPVEVEDVYVYDIEEDVTFDFETKKYLPTDFNPLKGIGDLDWNKIELIEIEEEVSIGFEIKAYLPLDFNALKGMHDLNWDTIELVETEEEVTIGFDTKQYLPKEFNALKGIGDLDWSKIELIEIEEEVDINFSSKLYLPVNFDSREGI